MRAQPGPRIGFRPPRSLFGQRAELAALIDRAETGGLDRLVVGDHVAFRGGRGFDGLVHATALAALSTRITVSTAVYQLPLRHPVTVARQIASLVELAPGRFEFGIGIGGEDPAEYEVCGVDPASRGGRADEAVAIVRSLLAGDVVTVRGEHFSLTEARILPTPPEPVPILVGGRSRAAWRRTARHGDGWIALWVSPDRFAEGVAAIGEMAGEFGRTVPQWRHGMHVWCGFGSDVGSATAMLAREMEELYGLPFARFARYCPAGTPDDVAAALAPYLKVGCAELNLIAVAEDWTAALDGALAVRALLS